MIGWLARLPTTNALVATGILLAIGTAGRVWFTGWAPPDGWLTFIVAFSVTGAAQFTAKRMTWHEASPQNAPPEESP